MHDILSVLLKIYRAMQVVFVNLINILLGMTIKTDLPFIPSYIYFFPIYCFYGCITNLFKLKIRIDRKAELLNEYLLEGRNIVLFIKKQHSLFVVDAIYSSE